MAGVATQVGLSPSFQSERMKLDLASAASGDYK